MFNIRIGDVISNIKDRVNTVKRMRKESEINDNVIEIIAYLITSLKKIKKKIKSTISLPD